MNRVIWLADGEPKCIASACRRGAPCARMLVVYKPGRKVADLSIPGGSHVADCRAPLWSMWVDPAKAVKPAGKPVVKEWIGGRL